jgi:alkanesulfonate monooxygenase SsuD/methylene tetrahydromethanopterin reductase-like flavin-dependent oxidoreductase (luciferase family)
LSYSQSLVVKLGGVTAALREIDPLRDWRFAKSGGKNGAAMKQVQFGFCVPTFAFPGTNLFRTPNYAALDAQATMQIALHAAELGYDSLWVADHLMLGQDEAILEGWTVLAALAGSTHTAKLGMIHQANLFRYPAVAAKMVATLDQIAGGRLIHFIDAGTQRREHLAYGLPWSDNAEEQSARLIESIELMIALWTANGPIDYAGFYYQVTGAVCAPAPIQRPHPPIWLGEAHPATLNICARYGQGWNTVPVAIPELRDRLALLRAACKQATRPYEELEKSLEIQVLIAPDRAALRQQLREIIQRAPSGQAPDRELAAFIGGMTDELPDTLSETWLAGTPDEIEQRVRAYVAEGISHFMLWFIDAPSQVGLRLFAAQVAPRFR